MSTRMQLSLAKRFPIFPAVLSLDLRIDLSPSPSLLQCTRSLLLRVWSSISGATASRYFWRCRFPVTLRGGELTLGEYETRLVQTIGAAEYKASNLDDYEE